MTGFSSLFLCVVYTYVHTFVSKKHLTNFHLKTLARKGLSYVSFPLNQKGIQFGNLPSKIYVFPSLRSIFAVFAVSFVVSTTTKMDLYTLPQNENGPIRGQFG